MTSTPAGTSVPTSSNTDYLAEFDSAAPADKYPLVRRWMMTEPLPFFKQLRAQRPILVTPECVLVSKYADVIDLLQMPKIFTVDLYKPKMGVTATDPGYLMAHDDDAIHYREKSLMQGMLNRNDLPRIRALIAKASREILDNADGKIDIVYNYCRMVPAIMVQEYFGLDNVDKKDLIEWSFWNQYDVFHNQPFDLNSPEHAKYITDNHDRVTIALANYIKKVLIEKLAMVKLEQTKNIFLIGWRILKSLGYLIAGKKSPIVKDDVFSRMLRSSFANQVEFDLVRVGVNAGGLLIGSIETTSQAVSQVIDFFIKQPELLAKAKTAAQQMDLKVFDNIVWEALRYVPISPYMFRQTSQDYRLAKGTDYETLIPANTNVLVLTQSAMFDDFANTNPDEFNPDRTFYHNFNFGFGPHDCLGKYVGMEMIPEMVRQVLLLPHLRAAAPIDFKDGPFPESYSLVWG
ncbi:MAG TPA: cytochrome P450 [Cellvibrio sp.]|nr:cytochrome P450 [Cellvibrio sp.]